MNIVLIGFMGSGKTTIGRKLAVRLGYGFVDTDHWIEREQKLKITRIFEVYGEPHFRSLETDLLERLTTVGNTVVATGGGILVTPGNLELIRKIGSSVYLKAGVEEIFERVSRNTKRPLLQTENPLQKIVELLEERKHLYMQAEHIIDTGSFRMGSIVSKIIKEL
ncbi:MAG: shikimate kinase [Proteobacteria bacterium]|nr:shikimate kinase [Pseudomonadota bacterium]